MSEQTKALKLADAIGYNEDGSLFWKMKAGNGRIAAGTPAGYPTTCGGRKVMYQKKAYWAHHIVWLLHHGCLPHKFVDHINGDRSDNRIENLRLCTQSENMQNRSRSGIGASCLLGAHKRQGGKWEAAITLQGKKQWLGIFDTVEQAHFAYLSAKKSIHQFSPEPRP
jgi:hypothetical protein